MTVKINASTTSGLVLSPDTSGEIEFQANGTTIATISASGMDIPAGLTFGSPIDIASGGTGQTTATAAFNALAPSQSTNSGKYLTTDGTNTSWGTVTVPTLTSDLTNDSGFITGNQTITLSGDLSGSGTTSINAQLGANVVNANELNVTGNGTTSQYLRSDGDGTFTWATPPDTTANETITLSGDVSGSGTTSITVTVADDSHNHIISNVDGLQTALDGKQPLDADLTALGGLAKTDGNFIVGNGTTWVAESGATARTSLGLGSLATLSTVDASTITDNSVGAAELNVSGNGTTSQFLRSDGDGTFTWATPSGGKVLQVVQDTLVGKVSTTSSSFVDTGLSVSITPSSTSSKVLVIATMSSIGANVTAFFNLVRNSTNIAVGTGGTNNITEGITVDATGRALHASFNYLDSPATTSATTYKIQYAQNGGGSVSINGRVSDGYIAAYSTIIAMEIGA